MVFARLAPLKLSASHATFTIAKSFATILILSTVCYLLWPVETYLTVVLKFW